MTTPERRALRRDKSKGGEAERKEGAETGFDWPEITCRYSTRESVVVTASTCVSGLGTDVLNRLKGSDDGTTRATVSGAGEGDIWLFSQSSF